MNGTKYVGMDVHQATISVAVSSMIWLPLRARAYRHPPPVVRRFLRRYNGRGKKCFDRLRPFRWDTISDTVIFMSDVTSGTWNVAASPIIVEYLLVVVEEIRREVAEGFQKLSGGGIEVGGLLYGVREGQTVRIMAIRPSICEHSNGPGFRFSERDRAALREQIRQAQEDPRLAGLVCVGWYVSHTRSEIALSESDQEIFSTFFPQPWQ
jgi:proteasome lid subunit RPN8/RPN11